MRALVKQQPAWEAEVWFEDAWLPWMGDGRKMAVWPKKYAYCENAESEDPFDYTVTEVDVEGEDGEIVRTFVAVQSDGDAQES